MDNKLPHNQTCLVDICKYPRTCEWNNCCMEGEMKKSLDAKKKIEEGDSERSDLKNKDA